MLYLIGLGLADERDITVKGLEIVRRCARVYLEAYTSILHVDRSVLEQFYERPVLLADREFVESSADEMLDGADAADGAGDVALLVVGDPLGATTHTDLVHRARERGIGVRIIHNASIMNAAGCCGLQLYSFGQTVSICFFDGAWRPDSFYDRIRENKDIGLHTLCLLDIKVKEQTVENMMRGNKIYEPPRYMTVNQAVAQMLEVDAARLNPPAPSSDSDSDDGDGDDGTKQSAQSAQPAAAAAPPSYSVCGPEALAVGIARVGADDQVVKAGSLARLLEEDFGAPLHSLVLVGSKLHYLEAELLRMHAADADDIEQALSKFHIR